jgi:hypothetical protein
VHDHLSWLLDLKELVEGTVIHLGNGTVANASRAEVEIGAIQTFVPYTRNCQIAVITDNTSVNRVGWLVDGEELVPRRMLAANTRILKASGAVVKIW